MKSRKRNTIIFLTLLLLVGAGYLAKDKLSCFTINYQLQHSDIEIVKSDSAQYYEQFKNLDGQHEYKLSLIEFGGQGCKPCMRMDTVLSDISNFYGSELNLQIIRLTNRENRKIAKYFDIKMIPVQVILNQQGIEVFRHIGFLSKEELQAEIDKHL